MLPESMSNPEDRTQLCLLQGSNKCFGNRMRNPKGDVDRLYIPRNEEGRGMIQLELSYKISTVGQHKYLTTID